MTNPVNEKPEDELVALPIIRRDGKRYQTSVRREAFLHIVNVSVKFQNIDGSVVKLTNEHGDVIKLSGTPAQVIAWMEKNKISTPPILRQMALDWEEEGIHW